MVAATMCLQPLAVAEDDDRFNRIEAYVNAYQQMAAFDGVVLIAEGDEIAWQKAFGYADYRSSVPMRTDTVFRIASLSKQATQAAIGRLVDQGKLRLESRLSDFLPEFPNSRRISIKQLLDHTAGIAHTNRLDWMDMHEAMTLDAIVEGLAGEELLFPPGSNDQYSNGGYAILAEIIEIASGLSFGDFINKEIAEKGFYSIGHESAFEIVPKMASRYAPGPVYGERVEAEPYITANRIGGGSLHANAEDVFRFFRASYGGQIVAAETSAAVFELPEDGDLLITGRSPGALAQVYLDFEDDLTVVTLSSNSAWPGSFNADIVSLYRDEDTALAAFELSDEIMSPTDVEAIIGDYQEQRFGWDARIEAFGNSFVFIRNNIRTAFARTTDGEFHLPIYDWLCRFSDYGTEFECRQRDPDATIRFRYLRI